MSIQREDAILDGDTEDEDSFVDASLQADNSHAVAEDENCSYNVNREDAKPCVTKCVDTILAANTSACGVEPLFLSRNTEHFAPATDPRPPTESRRIRKRDA